MPIKLTKRALDGIKPGSTIGFWYDADLKGFGLKAMPSGVTTWIVEYRPGAGVRGTSKRRMALGKAGALTPDETRAPAKDILVKVHAGQDPAALKVEAKAVKTVTELCALHLAEADLGNIVSKRGVPKKASTLASDRGRILRHIKPLLGKKLVRDVSRADIERFLRDVASGKTAVDVKTKHADNQGARFLSISELERLGAALREAESTGIAWQTKLDEAGAKHLPKSADDRSSTSGSHAAAAIRLLILTGCRLREIRDLKWQHVDQEHGSLHLPDSKTGAKTIVLAAPALEVLATVPRIEGSDFVIAGDDAKKARSDLKRPWAMVLRAAGLQSVRIHDLRHTYASHGAAAGMGLTIVSRLLGHADVKTTNRYSHFDADPMRRAADAIGSTLAAALGSKGDGQSNVVVPNR